MQVGTGGWGADVFFPFLFSSIISTVDRNEEGHEPTNRSLKNAPLWHRLFDTIATWDCVFVRAGWTPACSAFPTTCSSPRRTPCNSFSSILMQISSHICWTDPLFANSSFPSRSCHHSAAYLTHRTLLRTLDFTDPHVWHCGRLLRQRPHPVSREWRLCARWQTSRVSKCPENGGAGEVLPRSRSVMSPVPKLHVVHVCSWPSTTMAEARATDACIPCLHPQRRWQTVLMEGC